ncbi:MAG: DUF1122 family protein [Archaeoglobaceae archaeon]
MAVGVPTSDFKAYFERKELNGYPYSVNTFEGRSGNEIRFELFLVDEDDVSEEPVVYGRYFAGESYYRPWLEIHYKETVNFGSRSLSLMEEGLDEGLFKQLSELLPPASHIMVFYSNYPETEKALSFGVPPPATYIGYLLFQAGCTWFKDWYFPEGFMEGGVKLQGNKSLDQEHRKKALNKLKSELLQFLHKDKEDSELFLNAEKRAKEALDYIEKELQHDVA